MSSNNVTEPRAESHYSRTNYSTAEPNFQDTEIELPFLLIPPNATPRPQAPPSLLFSDLEMLVGDF